MQKGQRTAAVDPSDRLYLTLATLVGIAGGAAGSLFHYTVKLVNQWPEWIAEAVVGRGVAIVLAALAAIAMGCVARFLVIRFAPEAAGSGVQEIEGAMEGLRVVRWRRVLPVKFVGGVLALSSGLVAGREGPTIHIGASLAQAVAERCNLDREALRGLLAAGAAAGLSAAFNAPLAAILFIVEETRRQFPYTFRSYCGVIVAAAASAVVTDSISGTQPDLAIAALQMPLWSLPAFLLLGVVLGVIGVGFNATLLAVLDAVQPVIKRWPYLPITIVGGVLGALTLILPLATGDGEPLILRLVEENLPLTMLLTVALVRFVGTIATYGCAVPGGVFSPLLTLATTIGLAFGTVAELALPLPEGATSAFAIAAMAGLFTATIRAPVVGVVLVAELTGSYGLILPVIVTSIVAHLVAEHFRGRPLYEVLLERTLRLAAAAVPPPADATQPPASAPASHGLDGRQM